MNSVEKIIEMHEKIKKMEEMRNILEEIRLFYYRRPSGLTNEELGQFINDYMVKYEYVYICKDKDGLSAEVKYKFDKLTQ